MARPAYRQPMQQPQPAPRPQAMPSGPAAQAPARPQAAERPQQPAKSGGWKVALQFVIGLAVIAAVAGAIVWLYLKYYTQ